MSRLAAALVVLAAAAVARAAPIKIAIVPLHDSNPGADAAPVEAALIEAAQKTPALELRNVAGGKLTGARVSLEGRADARVRAQALGRESGAARVLIVDIARLGDGRVIYLQVIETAGARPFGSTTVSLPGSSQVSPPDREQLRAALARAIAPDRYLGRLVVHIDVAGAELQLDGKQAPPGPTVELPVGTHALRVTHPAYRDFLRFVDVEFDRTQTLEVGLSAFPLAEGEMTERMRQQAPRKRVVPWYRSWWALTIAGVAVASVTAGAIYGSRPSVQSDRTVTYRPPQAP